MKKSTKLVSAVVVLAVLGGVYVGLNTYVSKEEKTESSEEESKTEVFSVKTDDIKSLEFIVDKKEVTFEKKDDSWVKKDETAFPVNQTTLDSAASAIETVETVVLLSQQKPDDTIEIDLDLDELDATSAELKATYQEIKDYVLKEFGLKVSNLYISQVKRKCGIEVGENYNLPKTENPKVLQCPKEKEDAIKAALKYFAMI